MTEGDLALRLLGGGERDRDLEREIDLLCDERRTRGDGLRAGESRRAGGEGLRGGEGRFLGGGGGEDREERVLASREGDRLLGGGDLYLRGGERERLGVMDRERRRPFRHST